MSCELDPETLIEALYGEASPATLERVRSHVGTCLLYTSPSPRD